MAGRPTTEVVIYGLGELNEDYAARNPVRRAIGGLAALVDFVASGTFFRYLSISWRYGFFFIFPLLVLIGAALAARIAYLVGSALVAAAPALAGWAAALCAFLLVLVYAARRLHFLLVMDDWAFARDLARGRNPELDRRLALLSADVRRRIGETAAGEDRVLGAQFRRRCGGDRACRGAGRPRAPARYGLMTVGSSLLKIALHPAAKACAARSQPSSGPAARGSTCSRSPTSSISTARSRRELLAGAAGPDQTTTKVRFRSQLSDQTYRAIKRDFFRVHRQFVFGVERRSHYSYHAILCGPEPFAEVARHAGLSDDWTAFAAARDGTGAP